MSKDRKKILAANITRLLEEKGLSQADLARISGFTPQEVWAWVNGKYFPTSRTRSRLASALEVSVERLTNGHKPAKIEQADDDHIRKIVEDTIEDLFKAFEWSTKPPTWLREEIRLEFPKPPGGLTEEESYRWNMNELALRRWENLPETFYVPIWALKRFCLEAKGPYEDGKLQEVTGILKDFIKAGKE